MFTLHGNSKIFSYQFKPIYLFIYDIFLLNIEKIITVKSIWTSISLKNQPKFCIHLTVPFQERRKRISFKVRYIPLSLFDISTILSIILILSQFLPVLLVLLPVLRFVSNQHHFDFADVKFNVELGQRNDVRLKNYNRTWGD